MFVEGKEQLLMVETDLILPDADLHLELWALIVHSRTSDSVRVGPVTCTEEKCTQ